MNNNIEMMIVFYVANQEKSKEFYKKLLKRAPVLDVPGMTEFFISQNTKLGLMPESGIYKLLGEKIINPSSANGIPRCELYIKCENPEEEILHLEKIGGTIISYAEKRNWGDIVSYGADYDGNILAFYS